mgnify:CR=1 FL=1
MNKKIPNLKLILPNNEKCSVCVVGLGYVGLPLAVQIAKTRRSFGDKKKLQRNVIGFDINPKRIKELKIGFDKTLEIKEKNLKNVLQKKFLKFTNKVEDIIDCEIFIVTVPTPINEYKKPDLSLIKDASQMIGLSISKRKNKNNIPIIIFESTVYPGATEEVCVPIIEKFSGMKLNHNSDGHYFHCGYSPERINPGDKKHSISEIKKVTSGSNNISSKWINNFYKSFIKAGTHLAPSIKVAEAAKIIENTQRDLNIALVNELSIIFEKMNIDTLDIIEAASTKWNFIKFTPGLVGGHCIGVDPYYLTHKSQELGYEPKIVLAGRELNDNMSFLIVNRLLSELNKRKIDKTKCKILILGITFKENCPDLRNSKVLEIINLIQKFNSNITVIEPYFEEEKNIDLKINIQKDFEGIQSYDVILSTVKHREFLNKKINFWRNVVKENHIILDVKGFMPRCLNTIRL